MELLFRRYRNVTVLLLVLFTQLVLLAYQIRGNQQVLRVRAVAVAGVAPVASVFDGIRSSIRGFFSDYFLLLDVREESRRMKAENNRLKIENNFLRSELATADRTKSLLEFKSRSPSQTLAARIIATSTSSKTVVLIDRGANDGVAKGMAVITGDGIIGKVVDAFPVASQVQIITDPLFGAGVVSQKNRVYGTLKGQGHNRCLIDRISNEDTVEVGEMFYTTGEDRIFPKGIPVGRVVTSAKGPIFKNVEVVPSGFANGVDEVLVVLEGVHQDIPQEQAVADKIYMMPPPPPSDKDGSTLPAGMPSGGTGAMTDADRLLDRYRAKEQEQGAKFGSYGSKPPDLTTIPARGIAAPPAADPSAPKEPGEKKAPEKKAPAPTEAKPAVSGQPANPAPQTNNQ